MNSENNLIEEHAISADDEAQSIQWTSEALFLLTINRE